MEKLKINIPEGYDIDLEKSNLKEGIIFFKKNMSEFDQLVKKGLNGYIISYLDNEVSLVKMPIWRGGVFPTEAQAKSALALANLLQLMQLPQYNGDWSPDWSNNEAKKCICASNNTIIKGYYSSTRHMLAFKNVKSRDLFLENHEDLIKQYFMIS